MKQFYLVSLGLALTVAFAGPASAGLPPANDPSFDDPFFQDSTRIKKHAGKGSYIDLNTGKPVTIRYDAATRTSYNNATGQPIDFYVNTTTGDTLYGSGKYIVNSYLMKSSQGAWALDTTRVRVTNSGLWSIQDNTELKMEKKDKMHKMHKKNKPDSMQQQQPQPPQ